MSARGAIDWKQLKLYSTALLFAGLSNVAFAGDTVKASDRSGIDGRV